MCNKFAICAHYSSLFLKLRFHKTHISLFINGLSPWVEYAECWEVLQMSNRLRLLSLWSFAWKHADIVGLRATWHIPLHWMKCLINCPKHVDRRINRDYFIIKLRSFFYYMRSPFSCWSWTERVRGGGSQCSRFQLKTWWIHDRPLTSFILFNFRPFLVSPSQSSCSRLVTHFRCIQYVFFLILLFIFFRGD